MYLRHAIFAYALVFLGAGLACADFIQEFSGFDSIRETGVSGLVSSYFGDLQAGLPVSGPYIAGNLAQFGPQRVTYPSGIGAVPSPGGEIGLNFDQGALGIKVDGDQLVVKLATALDPTSGYYHTGWKSWYGQGDVFLSVADDEGVNHFALLNVWARDDKGNPRNYNNNYFNKGENFHLKGGTKNAALEGHLIALQNDSDVLLTGGTGAYGQSNAPAGLDRRVFASGGLDLGEAGLVLASFMEDGRRWYTQTWSFALSSITSAKNFDVGLHAAASCGNDQIGGRFNVVVPEPSSLLLLICGLLAWRQSRA